VLLSKGFEVEIYTCTPTGDAVGLSDRIVADLQGFVREPDSRNVEYTTPPLTKYELLCMALLEPRRQLRQYLRSLGDYTVMPGSTLALGGSEYFQRSDPKNPYHGYIEHTYGTKVVTASIHINVGIPNTEELIRACRLVRMEAGLYLALSASSPFLSSEVTGSHSSRWQMFPKTPVHVPLFSSHQHYINWSNHQIQIGVMQNVRHLWSAVRPNGDNRPYDLNRLELRICDLVIDPLALLAITTLLEMRLQMMLADPQIDPLLSTKFSPDELMAIADQNEVSAARNSLDAELINWENGEKIIARDWIWQQYAQVKQMANAQGVFCFLSPLQKILNQGNEAQRWLAQVAQGLTPPEIMVRAIAEVAQQEQDLADTLLG
jgi:predicted glutamate--cysteine ligase